MKTLILLILWFFANIFVLRGDSPQIVAQGKTMGAAAMAANHIAYMSGTTHSYQQTFRNLDGTYTSILYKKPEVLKVTTVTTIRRE